LFLFLLSVVLISDVSRFIASLDLKAWTTNFNGWGLGKR